MSKIQDYIFTETEIQEGKVPPNLRLVGPPELDITDLDAEGFVGTMGDKPKGKLFSLRQVKIHGMLMPWFIYVPVDVKFDNDENDKSS